MNQKSGYPLLNQQLFKWKYANYDSVHHHAFNFRDLNIKTGPFAVI